MYTFLPFPSVRGVGREGEVSQPWAAGKLWVGGGSHQKLGTFPERKGGRAVAGAEVVHGECRGWFAEEGLRSQCGCVPPSPAPLDEPSPTPYSVDKPQKRCLLRTRVAPIPQEANQGAPDWRGFLGAPPAHSCSSPKPPSPAQIHRPRDQEHLCWGPCGYLKAKLTPCPPPPSPSPAFCFLFAPLKFQNPSPFSLDLFSSPWIPKSCGFSHTSFLAQASFSPVLEFCLKSQYHHAFSCSLPIASTPNLRCGMQGPRSLAGPTLPAPLHSFHTPVGSLHIPHTLTNPVFALTPAYFSHPLTLRLPLP
nr:oncostatin-M isoform X1 [Loxodonta africana]